MHSNTKKKSFHGRRSRYVVPVDTLGVSAPRLVAVPSSERQNENKLNL